jgi:hypothetical protein
VILRGQTSKKPTPGRRRLESAIEGEVCGSPNVSLTTLRRATRPYRTDQGYQSVRFQSFLPEDSTVAKEHRPTPTIVGGFENPQILTSAGFLESSMAAEARDRPSAGRRGRRN